MKGKNSNLILSDSKIPTLSQNVYIRSSIPYFSAEVLAFTFVTRVKPRNCLLLKDFYIFKWLGKYQKEHNILFKSKNYRKFKFQ